ncbi:mannosyltransferase family protein [Gorillibacterium sp. sgz5001074]|uniref:mannosyltransferase family protein n=1 Tax=Gorillibacterium sp. sgz5001074 TaxID=3446695 RepID=UPI003F6761BD
MERFRTHSKILLVVLGMLALSRMILYMEAYLGSNLFSNYSSPREYVQAGTPEEPYPQMKLPRALEESRPVHVRDLLKFDTYSYMKITERGYDRFSMDQPHPPANWVFFPLYPLTVASAAKLLPFWDTLTVGIVLSHVYLWLALSFIYKIGLAMGWNDKRTRSVIFLVLLYPASAYYSLMYTESLFLLLSAATIYFSITRRFGAALLIGGLSTVTRVPGFANLVFAAGSLILAKGFKWSWRDLKYAGFFLASLLPLIAYFGYLKRLTGDFLAAVHEQANWARETSFPFQAYWHFIRKPYFSLGGGWDNGVISFTMTTFVLTVFAAAFLLQFRRFRREPSQLLFFAYGALLITVPFSSSPEYLTSVVRYMMVSLPLYFYLQELGEKHDLVRYATIGLLGALQAIITIGLINDYTFVI